MTSAGFLQKTLLMGLCCLSIFGCTIVDAIVSSPAAGTDQRPSPDRLVAVARVFEAQGHTEHASRLYEMALKASPDNDFASRRVAAIAARQHQNMVGPTAIEKQVLARTDIKTRDFLPQQQDRVIAPAATVQNVSFSRYASEEANADSVFVESEKTVPPLACLKPLTTFELDPTWISERHLSYLTDRSSYFGVGK